MARQKAKSKSDILAQRNRIENTAYRQYGNSQRTRNLSRKAEEISKRYIDNINATKAASRNRKAIYKLDNKVYDHELNGRYESAAKASPKGSQIEEKFYDRKFARSTYMGIKNKRAGSGAKGNSGG